MDEAAPKPPTQALRWMNREAAEAWGRNAAQRQTMMAPATELMLALAGVRKGLRVLDIAAGMGDQSVLAAQRVGPEGSVLATDISPVMLEGAERRARELGLHNLEFRVLDAQEIGTLGSQVFDAAICRNGLMFPPDLDALLNGVFQVLKPGGCLGVIVWSEASRNPYQEIPRRVLAELGVPLPPTTSQASRLGTPEILEAALKLSGFVPVQTQRMAANRQFSSAAEAFSRMREVGAVGEILSTLSVEEHTRVAAAIERELQPFVNSAGCRIPGESLVGGGMVPLQR